MSLPMDLAASTDDLTRISQFFSDISEDDLVSNFEKMASKSKRKMTFTLGGKNATHSAKAVTIRFTPKFLKNWHPESKAINPAEVRKRANTDLAAAFKGGQIVLEVLNKDDTRTAYASEKTAKKIRTNKLQLSKKHAENSTYAEIKVVDAKGFEAIANSLLANIRTSNESMPMITTDTLNETSQSEQSTQKLAPTQFLVQKNADKTVTLSPKPTQKSKKPKEVEDTELLKEEEKYLATQRDKKHEKQADAFEKKRQIDKTENIETRQEDVKDETKRLDKSSRRLPK